MVKRDEIIQQINKILGEDILKKSVIKDDAANGVQIFGGEDVGKVTLGVSLNAEFLEKSVEAGSNFCILHHGFDLRIYKSRFSKAAQERLRITFKNDITVVGLHYALDAQPQIGNNAIIINKLGAKLDKPFYDEWGYTAVFDKEQDLHELAHKCQEIFNHDIFAVEGNKEKIKKIAVVSGGAKPYPEYMAEMEAEGVELFISGETSESSPHMMKDAGIAYFVCGHYATEVFGVQALGEELKSAFKNNLEVEFIDVYNEI